MSATTAKRITVDQLRNTARFGSPLDADSVRRLADQQDDLLDALAAVTADAAQAVKDIGGCDHAVGICCCAQIRNVECATELLRQYGRQA